MGKVIFYNNETCFFYIGNEELPCFSKSFPEIY